MGKIRIVGTEFGGFLAFSWLMFAPFFLWWFLDDYIASRVLIGILDGIIVIGGLVGYSLIKIPDK